MYASSRERVDGVEACVERGGRRISVGERERRVIRPMKVVEEAVGWIEWTA